MSSTAPIGVFDSGVGGLSILREIRRLLPHEDLFFYADSGFCPYGTKAPEQVRARVFAIADFLLAQGAKLLVLACNTACAVALNELRERVSVPVVGVEPAVKPAATATRSGRVGILATPGTLRGERYHSLLDRYGDGLEVASVACPKFVPLVEAGKVDGDEVEAVVHEYLDPLLTAGVDTVVLGCTHYPFLREVVQRLSGPTVTVIDTGPAVALQTQRILETHDLLAPRDTAGQDVFFTSGDAGDVVTVTRLLWGDARVVVTYAEV
ncbi:MAG: glutamate racemase [Armatimonadota bacterium]